MPVDLKNSETLKNLMRAFAGESQARNRYTFAASLCKKQELHVLEAVFQFTASQEKEHAEIFYDHMKELAGEAVHIDGGYPVDITNDVVQLLRYAQRNEYEEFDPVYAAFADTAKAEGFPRSPLLSGRSRRSSRPTATVLASSRTCWKPASCSSPTPSAAGCA